MLRPAAKPSDTEIEGAIARVLKAEQDARDATVAARSEAAEKVDAARIAASGLAHRAERRIRRIRRAFEERAQAAQREIAGEIAALARSAGEEAHALRREADAVEILAAELTGGDHD
jgi:hypothetical protein